MSRPSTIAGLPGQRPAQYSDTTEPNVVPTLPPDRGGPVYKEIAQYANAKEKNAICKRQT
jgi:hypothetical protein